MRTLDQGHQRSRLPGQETLARECRSCAIAQSVTDPGTRSGAPYVTEEVDDDVVVISGPPDLDGSVVIPRQHVGGLEALSVRDRAHLLAVLRRVTQSVQERNRGSATRILVKTDAPGAEGHVCFHVVPDDSEDPVGPPPQGG